MAGLPQIYELGQLPVPLEAPPLKTGIGGPVTAGLIIITLAFGGLGIWSGLAPLSSAAIAPGVVNVDTNRKTVQHLEGGIVGDILVTEGSVVEAGQVLVRLDDTRADASYHLLQGQYLATLALEARLAAERDGHPAIAYPTELVRQRGAPDIDEIIAAQDGLFAARLRSLEGETSVLRQRVTLFEEEIKGLRAQQKAKEHQSTLIREEYKSVKELYDKGYERKPRLLALERAQAALEGDRGELIAQISRARQAIGEAELRIIDRENNFQQEVVAELRDVQVKIAELRDRVRAQEDVLQRVDIRAPLAGTVVDLKVHTPGGVIAPGAPILDIVPSEERLVIEARLRPDDIDTVHVGLPAEVRLTAYKRRNTPTIAGHVIQVSADRFIDDRTGLSYYLARIELDDGALDFLEDVKLYPGMPAEVMIETGKRVVIDYLLGPIIDSIRRAFRED